MKNLVKQFSPLMKFFIGMFFILSSVLLGSIYKYEFVNGILMGIGLAIELLAIISFVRKNA